MSHQVGLGTFLGAQVEEDFDSTASLVAAHTSRVTAWECSPNEQFLAAGTLGGGVLGPAQESGTQRAVRTAPSWSAAGFCSFSSGLFELLLALACVNGSKTGAGPYTKTYALEGYNGGGISGTYFYLDLLASRPNEGVYDGVWGAYITDLSLEARGGELLTWSANGLASVVNRDVTPGSVPTISATPDDIIAGGMAGLFSWNSHDFDLMSWRLRVQTGRAGFRTQSREYPGPPAESMAMVTLEVTLADSEWSAMLAAVVDGYGDGAAVEADASITYTSKVDVTRSFQLVLQNAVVLAAPNPVRSRGVLVRTVTFQALASATKSGLKFVCVNAINGPV